MILFVNSEGVITAISPTTINQGSIGVNTITIIAPFSATTSCFVAYRLPNGLATKPQFVNGYENNDAATLLEAFSNKFKTEDGTELNAWQTTITQPITERSGSLEIQVFFVADGRVLTSTSIEQPINNGVNYIPPELTENEWTDVLNVLSQTKQAAENAEDSAEAAANSAEAAENSANTAIKYAYFDAIIRGSDENTPQGTMSTSELDTEITEAAQGKDHCVILIEDLIIRYEEGYGDIVIGSNISEVYLRNINTVGVPEDGLITMAVEEGSKGCIIHGDGVEIKQFGVWNFTKVDGINCSDISFCTNISNSTTTSFYNCKYIDPFTTKGFTDSSDEGKSIAVGEDGTVSYLPPPTVDMTFTDNTLSISVTHGGEGSTKTVELPFSTVFDYKGSRVNFTNLPETGNSTGDVYNIQNPFEINGKDYPADTNVVWDGSGWDALGGAVDLSGYLEKPTAEVDSASLLGVNSSGNTIYYAFSKAADVNTIARRDESGELRCTNPTQSTSAVNLGYLNGVIGNLAEILEILHSGSGGTV